VGPFIVREGARTPVTVADRPPEIWSQNESGLQRSTRAGQPSPSTAQIVADLAGIFPSQWSRRLASTEPRAGQKGVGGVSALMIPKGYAYPTIPVGMWVGATCTGCSSLTASLVERIVTIRQYLICVGGVWRRARLRTLDQRVRIGSDCWRVGRYA
jgi:hypothetical protein